MGRWRKRLFGDCWQSEDKTIQLLTPCNTGRAGIIFYGGSDLEIVADWEGAPGGILIWRNRIAQLFPDAGVPADLTVTRVIKDMLDAFAGSGMKLYVSDTSGAIEIHSSDDWIRGKPDKR